MASGQVLSYESSATQRVRSLTVRLMAEKQRVRLGNAMRARRHELELSPGQVAADLYISGKTLERWERGETMGALRNVDKIAAILKTTEELLLAGVDEDKPTETPDIFSHRNGNGNGDIPDAERLGIVLDHLAALQSTIEIEAAAQEAFRQEVRKKLAALSAAPKRRASGRS